MDINKFESLSDDELLQKYEALNSKILCMIMMSDDERVDADLLFSEIKRRGLIDEVITGNNTSDSKE